jgi:hypothetical protein
MEIEESNKLIAEFMNIKHKDDNLYIDLLREMKSNGVYFEQGYMVSELKYNTSWDWLMPVVEKCYQCDYEEGSDLHMLLNDAIMTINISEVYKAVVEFIQWYNKEQERLNKQNI